jgi:hypothetical protein
MTEPVAVEGRDAAEVLVDVLDWRGVSVRLVSVGTDGCSQYESTTLRAITAAVLDALLAGSDSVALIRDDQGVVRVVGLEEVKARVETAWFDNAFHVRPLYRLTTEGAGR